MPDESPDLSAVWTRAIDAARLRPGSPVAVKLAGRHVALFMHEGRVHACNNRCPHEGYPLVEGALDGDCKLTCHWHNWKFDLATGINQYGGDNLRIYPAKVEAGAIWIDLAEAPAEQKIARSLGHLDEAMADVDTPRIARELARIVKAGGTPEHAIAQAIIATHERLRYGMTHAYAGAEAWLRLADRLTDDVQRLACASEALAHIAFDVKGEARTPYADAPRAWSGDGFAAAVERQDEAAALSLVEGALDAGLRFDNIEPALTAAALAHYNDFGHSLIYLTHVRRLIARLGPVVERPLLQSWVRSLVYATREDLLPDFAGYATAVADWELPAPAPPDAVRPSPAQFEGRSVRDTLAATIAVAHSPPLAVHDALFEAAARNLLRFDERHALRTDNSVADNVGWLDFSHALTFAHAVREQCLRLPAQAAGLWARGLLQTAMFVGRNKAYLTGAGADAELERWSAADAAFDSQAIAAIVDHGIGLPIFPVHRLKTWTAVSEEIAFGLSDGARRAGVAAVNRLLAVRFKQRHALRNAQQALAFVAKED